MGDRDTLEITGNRAFGLDASFALGSCRRYRRPQSPLRRGALLVCLSAFLAPPASAGQGLEPEPPKQAVRCVDAETGDVRTLSPNEHRGGCAGYLLFETPLLLEHKPGAMPVLNAPPEPDAKAQDDDRD